MIPIVPTTVERPPNAASIESKNVKPTSISPVITGLGKAAENKSEISKNTMMLCKAVNVLLRRFPGKSVKLISNAPTAIAIAICLWVAYSNIKGANTTSVFRSASITLSFKRKAKKNEGRFNTGQK